MPTNASAPQTPARTRDTLAIFEASPVHGCLGLDAHGKIRSANALMREWLTGRRDTVVAGRRLAEWLVSTEDRKALDAAIGGVGPRPLDLRIRGAAGGSFAIRGELAGPDGDGRFFGIFRLGAEVSRTPAGMERSARLEALGSLTTGVAHDFNNLLTILIGNLSLVAEDLRDDSRRFPKLKAARDAARRGSDLIRQLLAFARQEPVASEPIDPAKVIRRIAPLIQRALGRRIEFKLDLESDAGTMLGNSAQLESVIVNLAINARDAIVGNGMVRIAVTTVTHGGGRLIGIEVADTGTGIPAAVVDRVFEPFFTTKAEGKGSGLGLSMVRAYAEAFGGEVSLDTAEDKGTTVRLRFPRHREAIEESAAMTMPVAALPSGNELVVVVTTDESLASMIEQILGVLGYRCRTVCDAAEVAVMTGECRPDLVISDGAEPAAMLAARPGRAGAAGPAILALTATDEGDRGFRRLLKPFSLPDLALAVRETLDASV